MRCSGKILTFRAICGDGVRQEHEMGGGDDRGSDGVAAG